MNKLKKGVSEGSVVDGQFWEKMRISESMLGWFEKKLEKHCAVCGRDFRGGNGTDYRCLAILIERIEEQNDTILEFFFFFLCVYLPIFSFELLLLL